MKYKAFVVKNIIYCSWVNYLSTLGNYDEHSRCSSVVTLKLVAINAILVFSRSETSQGERTFDRSPTKDQH